MENARPLHISEKIIDILLVISIFLNAIVLTKSPAEIYLSYIPMLLLLPIFIMRYGFSKIVLKLFFPLVIMGVIYVLLGENTWGQFIKIAAGFFTSVLFFHLVIEHYNYDLKRLFSIYISACYIIAIIGIIQLIAYTLGIEPLYRYKWIFNKWGISTGGLGIRVNSIFSEPAYLAASLAPAMFTSLYNLFFSSSYFISKRKSIIILITYFLSFSSLGIFVVFIAIVLLLLKKGLVTSALLSGPIVMIAFFLAYNTIDEFKDRVDGTTEIFTTQNIYSYDVHGSSFVLYNNYHVATTNFAKNPLFGTGLGSHAIAFDKYSLTKQIGAVKIEFNSADANSMLLRLLSETGLFGLGFFIFFVVKNFLNNKRAISEEYWLISMGCLLIILVHLLRQGHYFYNGFPFFIWLYYYANKISQTRLEKLNENE